MAAFIVGQFDLTHGALAAQTPEKFGIEEIWQVEGNLLGTGLFYSERRPSRRAGEPERLNRALDQLSSDWLLRRYPWSGSLSTAHTLAYYVRFGRDVFRQLAGRRSPGVLGARPLT